MLKIKDLVVNYGHISALRGVSLTVQPNEIVALIGANGAGKTTMLMSISGLVDKEDGAIQFLGEDITDQESSAICKAGICHVPEGRHIFPRFSVEENLVSGAYPKKATKTWIKERIEEMYELFPRLRERRRQMGGTLSGGEQQMLAIARGLMSDPKLIMLDEPSLGLAPIIVEEIFTLISSIKESRTVLLIEQNANMALQISDRGYVLDTGCISLEGPSKDLLVNDDVRRAYLGI